MTKLSVEELVRAVVARSVRGRSPGQIANAMTLRELGYDDADTQELQLRLIKAVSPRRPTASKLEQALPIAPDSKVAAVIEGLQAILPARAVKGGGEDLGDPRRREVEVAVIAALSEISPNVDFSQVEAEMKLGKDLGLDATAIAEARIGAFKTLLGKAFAAPLSTVQVGPSSTVEIMVELVHGAFPTGAARGGKALASSLPGDVGTGRKGNKETGIVASGNVGAGGKRVAGPLPGDVGTGRKGNKETGIVASGNVVAGRKSLAGPLTGDVGTGRKGNKEVGVVVSGTVTPGSKGGGFKDKKSLPPRPRAGRPELAYDEAPGGIDFPGPPPGISLAGDTTTGRKG